MYRLGGGGGGFWGGFTQFLGGNGGKSVVVSRVSKRRLCRELTAN